MKKILFKNLNYNEMKTVKTIFLVLFVFIFSQIKGKDIYKGDKVRITIDNILVEVSTSDLRTHTVTDANIPEKVKMVLAELENVEIAPPAINERIKVRLAEVYSYKKPVYKKLEFQNEKNLKKEVVLFQNEKLYTGQGNYVFEIEDLNYLIRIYLDKLEDATKTTSVVFSEKLNKADAHIPANRKKTYGWLILGQDNNFQTYFLDEIPPITTDQLALSAGIGTGLVKNQLVTDFHFRVGLTFGKKAVYKNKYFADYEIMYDFSAGTTGNPFQTNHFLSLGYQHNFSNNPEKNNWYGASLGYLINRKGDFFEENTFRLRINKQLNKTITVIPEIYFNDSFKNIYPGIRFSISF